MSAIQEMIQEQNERTRKAILETFKQGDDISISLIQRKCKSGYHSASRVFEQMVEEDIIKRGECGFGVSKYIGLTPKNS